MERTHGRVHVCAPPPHRRFVGFTLVELLIVIGIIALLVALLMPTLNSARAQARLTLCASNLRQLDAALQDYAAENHGYFPPNNRYDTSAPGTANWCNENTIGQFVQGTVVVAGAPGFGQLGGPVFTCPEDDHSMRSYAMNVWCSCVSDSVPSTIGALWRGSSLRMSSRTILLAERWSTAGTSATTYYAPPFMGGYGAKPGLRFGVGGGVGLPSQSHWKPNPISELPYMFHRRPGDGGASTQSYGRVNIAYVDGHVECKLTTDLADRTSGLSKMDSEWSPLDRAENY